MWSCRVRYLKKYSSFLVPAAPLNVSSGTLNSTIPYHTIAPLADINRLTPFHDGNCTWYGCSIVLVYGMDRLRLIYASPRRMFRSAMICCETVCQLIYGHAPLLAVTSERGSKFITLTGCQRFILPRSLDVATLWLNVCSSAHCRYQATSQQ